MVLHCGVTRIALICWKLLLSNPKVLPLRSLNSLLIFLLWPHISAPLPSLWYTRTAIILEKILGPLSSHPESIFTHADFFLSSCAICFKGNSYNIKVSHAQVQSFRRYLKHRARTIPRNCTFEISTSVLRFNKSKGKQLLLNSPFPWSATSIRLLPVPSAGASAGDARPAQTLGQSIPLPRETAQLTHTLPLGRRLGTANTGCPSRSMFTLHIHIRKQCLSIFLQMGSTGPVQWVCPILKGKFLLKIFTQEGLRTCSFYRHRSAATVS